MDFYPGEFSLEARDVIEREKIQAYRELLPRSVYDFNEQGLAIRCIMRIFLAFAKEACALRKERGRTIERIQSESNEFLRRLTIMVVFDKFPGLARHWISNWDGSIASDVERRFRATAEWKEFEELLLETPLAATTNAAPKSYEHAIASWKRRLGMPGGVRDANLSLLDAQTNCSLLGIESPDVEFIEHEAWTKFWEDANLPRAVELEWESVLSSRKIPGSGVDLGLTFALTKEYTKAISRASGKLADLLVTAAISRGGREQVTDHFRETVWRECLEFADQLGQWDIFASWVDRVTHIRWEAPVTSDGSPDRGQLGEAIKPRREFFEKRIGMYWMEWLGAIDRAIELRCTVSATQTIEDAEEKRKGMASASVESTNATVPNKGKGAVALPINWADLLDSKSISQKEAAEFLQCDPRTVRRRVTGNELTRSPKGRIVCNERLRNQIRKVHGQHVLR
jgi:hypothetical protein